MGYLHFVLYHLLITVPSHQLSDVEAQALFMKTERLSKLLHFVDKNYAYKIRLTDFAQQEQLTMTYLSHFIKDNLKQTFQEYVTTVRYNHARKLLLTTDKRIIDICIECGFSDPRYLTQAFLRNTGLSPKDYRSKHKEHIPQDVVKVYRSLHSSQQYYSAEKNLELLRTYQQRFT